METVTESEFVSDFKKELKNDVMAEILPLIVNRSDDSGKIDMPI